MSKNWRQSEICILILDKSQGRPNRPIAKHLSCDGLLHYKYIIQFAGERILKSVNIWGSYGKSLVFCFLTHGVEC